MWCKAYLLLGILRLYFGFCSSYLHPDEHFQGPEVMAGYIFQYPTVRTWEFASTNPTRSIFPLWPVYGLPLIVSRWMHNGALPEPVIALRLLRASMVSICFLFEDSAIRRLVNSDRQLRLALLLVSSSYVTWTWQVHTFSNSLETVAVLWSLVLLRALCKDPPQSQRNRLPISALLGFVVAFGTFNRITFPAFLAGPCIVLAPQLIQRLRSMIVAGLVAIVTALAAIIVDSRFYMGPDISFTRLLKNPVVAPWNSLLYNAKTSNLAQHGLHPYYQHVLVNLPQLIGPAFILLLSVRRCSLTLASLASGLAGLSLLPHQEARFLIPTVPLALSVIRIPVNFRKAWVVVWIVFNALMGLIMGIYHQGGILPAQAFLATKHDVSTAYWWKTYSPPTWVVNGKNPMLVTVDLMGLDKADLESRVCGDKSQHFDSKSVVLVAPKSATFLDRFIHPAGATPSSDMQLTKIWQTKTHMNLDDLDFAEDGFAATMRRLVGRRGLVVWNVTCPTQPLRIPERMHRDW